MRSIHRRSFERKQNIRDEFAKHLMGNWQQEFFLYLRPFNSTGRLEITLKAATIYTHYPGSSPKAYSEMDSIDLETELSRALEPYAPLIALGEPGEHYGAGRIKTEEEGWKSLFVNLAWRAKIIFVVPASTKGTQWELDLLAKKEILYKKTLLIIPPKILSSGRIGFSDTEVFREDAVRELSSRGISFEKIDTNQGLVMHYSSPEICAAIVNYVTPATQRGLLGFYLQSGYVKEHGKVMNFGLKNAIFSVVPDLEYMLHKNR